MIILRFCNKLEMRSPWMSRPFSRSRTGRCCIDLSTCLWKTTGCWMQRIPFFLLSDYRPELQKKVWEVLMPQATTLASSAGDPPSFGVTASALATTAVTQTVVDPTALATYNLTSEFLRSIRELLMRGDRQG